jgi:phage gp29-like protein
MKSLRPIGKELSASSGSAAWLGNVLDRMPVTNTEFLQRHEGRGLWDVFEEMMHDPHIQSVFRSRRAGVAGRSWEVVAGDDSTKARRIAGFVRKTLAAVPNFEHALAHLMKAIPYGHSVAEIMWRIDADAVRIDALRTRRPERFVLEANSEIKLLDSENGQAKALPCRKFLCHRNDPQDDVPYAAPLLLSLYWPWYFKKHASAFWMVLAEKFGIPSVIGRYPAHFTDADVGNLVRALTNLQQDSVAAVPADTKVELENIPVGEKGSFFRELLDFMNAEISKTVLGGTLTQEVGRVGSYAAAKTHQEVRQEIIAADARLLQTTLNSTLIRWLVDFNYGPAVTAPQFVIDYLPARGTPEFAQTLKTLSEMGYRVPSQFIAETFGLPEEETTQK